MNQVISKTNPIVMHTPKGSAALLVLSDSEVQIKDLENITAPFTLTIHRESARWSFGNAKLSPAQIERSKELIGAFLQWKKTHPRIFSMMKTVSKGY